MATQRPSGASPRTSWWQRIRRHPTDSYGLVLLLVPVDYLVISAFSAFLWGQALTVLLLGFTLLFALRTSYSRRIWQLLTILAIIVAMLSVAITAFVPGTSRISSTATLGAGVALIVTPVVILRRVVKHEVVTVETILGAVSVYLLLGFSFASLFAVISLFIPSSFFVDYPHAEATDYLFFSYTTLTTVGYGNLVPADNIGRMFAMLEALLGQIYLVIIVARLVALWKSHPPPSGSDQQTGGTQPAELEQLEHEASPDTHPLVSASPPAGEG